MSSTTEGIILVWEALPPEKQNDVADFGRFLLARKDDVARERRLDTFLRDSAPAEGDEPLMELVLTQPFEPFGQ